MKDDAMKDMDTESKRFTPDEANRMLPLVRRIVDDILGEGRKLRAIGRMAQPSPQQVHAYQQSTEELKALLAELDSLGCRYKDWNFQVGLVDFPAQIDGRDVLLCWRSDEPEVRYYHSPEDGYAGRREIPARLLAGTRAPV
jgi:hypothetical protein